MVKATGVTARALSVADLAIPDADPGADALQAAGFLRPPSGESGLAMSSPAPNRNRPG